MFVMMMFYGGAWYGFRYLDPNYGNASLDLVKQLVAAFLTLTVSALTAARKSDGGTNGTNGTTVKTEGTTVVSVPGTTVTTQPGGVH
jgi:hypothetical protein